MRPCTVNSSDVKSAVEELARASHENDVGEVAQNFSFTNPSFTQTLSLNTGSPTLANTNLVLATLLQILQKGGLHRTT